MVSLISTVNMYSSGLIGAGNIVSTVNMYSSGLIISQLVI